MSQGFNSMDDPSEYLSYIEHHGIKGQKWGIANGPPYPLDGSDYSAQEKKLNNYKSKETQRITSMEAKQEANATKRIASLEQKHDKLVSNNASEKKIQKNENAQRDAYAKGQFNSKIAKGNQDAVDNMTYESMKAEKKQVTSTVTSAMLMSLVSVAASSAVGLPIARVYTADVNQIKTDVRISDKVQEQYLNESMSAANDYINQKYHSSSSSSEGQLSEGRMSTVVRGGAAKRGSKRGKG